MKNLSLKRSTLTDAIVEAIQNQIIEGKLKPGEQLPSEKELCEIFDVGRSSVREALKALTLVGLLEKRKEGTFVTSSFSPVFKTPISNKLILKQVSQRDLLEARKVLEVQLVGLSANRATKEDLSIMESLLQEMNEKYKAGLNPEFIQCDVRYHLAIAESAQNEVLLSLMQAVKELLTDFQNEIISSPWIFKEAQKLHRLIFEAICERDENKAQKLMLKHLEDAERAYNEVVSQNMNDYRT